MRSELDNSYEGGLHGYPPLIWNDPSATEDSNDFSELADSLTASNRMVFVYLFIT